MESDESFLVRREASISPSSRALGVGLGQFILFNKKKFTITRLHLTPLTYGALVKVFLCEETQEKQHRKAGV